ncbi:MAG TPA: 50S ribosomal protein L23 [Candidatus Paceibacterota bacterium]|nr:50S ribosomal protein L23 [Candidatus Paceibacterota bacterium]
MAIFGKKKTDAEPEKAQEKAVKTEKKETKKSGEPSPVSLWTKRKHASLPDDLLKKMRITEKSAILSSKKIYTFEIDPSCGKKEVARAFQHVYGKTPVKINIVNVRGKVKRTRTGLGRTKAKKKAMVYLKPTERIDFV